MGLTSRQMLSELLGVVRECFNEEAIEQKKSDRKYYGDMAKICDETENRMKSKIDELSRRLELLENPDKLCSLEGMKEISS